LSQGLIDRLDPRSKAFFSLTVILLAIMIPEIEYMTGLIIMTGILVVISRSLVRWLSYLSIFKVLIPLLFFMNLFFYAQGQTFWSSDFYLFRLSVTRGGLITSITILLRLFSIAGAAALFAISTESIELETALTYLKVPWKLSFLFSLTLKLIPEMKTRYRKIEEAQYSRGIRIEGGPLEKTKKKIPILIPFLASIIRYGYELTEALVARDFNEIEKRSSLIELKHGPLDFLLYVISISIVSTYAYLYFL